MFKKTFESDPVSTELVLIKKTEAFTFLSPLFTSQVNFKLSAEVKQRKWNIRGSPPSLHSHRIAFMSVAGEFVDEALKSLKYKVNPKWSDEHNNSSELTMCFLSRGPNSQWILRM